MSLIEGNSIASTSRMTGAAKMTVLSLIREIGTACTQFHDAQVRYLATERVQCDEVWSFCGMKAKHVPEALKETVGIGSVWTWTALDADSKLLISWIVSDRSQEAADALIEDLKERTNVRLQVSTDGHSPYLTAIMKAFKYGECDYAEVIKVTRTVSHSPGVTRTARRVGIHRAG